MLQRLHMLRVQSLFGKVSLCTPGPWSFLAESELVVFNLSLKFFFFLNLLAGRKSVVQCLSQMQCDLRFSATLFRLGVLG